MGDDVTDHMVPELANQLLSGLHFENSSVGYQVKLSNNRINFKEYYYHTGTEHLPVADREFSQGGGPRTRILRKNRRPSFFTLKC